MLAEKNRENRPPPVTGNGVSPGSQTQKMCIHFGGQNTPKKPSAQHMTISEGSGWHEADPHGSPEWRQGSRAPRSPPHRSPGKRASFAAHQEIYSNRLYKPALPSPVLKTEMYERMNGKEGQDLIQIMNIALRENLPSGLLTLKYEAVKLSSDLSLCPLLLSVCPGQFASLATTQNITYTSNSCCSLGLEELFLIAHQENSQPSFKAKRSKSHSVVYPLFATPWTI